MKKLLAVVLALICAFSTFSAYVSAADLLGNVGDAVSDQLGFGDLLGGEDEADVLSYGIHYEMSMLSTVSLFYTPSSSITFTTPTYMEVTGDTPIALDHDWIAWKDPNTNKLYYPGDVIYVDGKITLEAVWVEKKDNYPSFIRSAVAGLKALIRVIEKFMGVYELITYIDENEVTTTVPAEVQ